MSVDLSILFDVISSSAFVAISVLLFSVVRKWGARVSLWYFGFSVVGFTIIIAGDISVMSLISLSKELAGSGMRDASYIVLALSKQDDYFGAHFMNLIAYSLGAFPLYFLFFSSKLLPRWLAGWGLLGALLVFVATWLQVFGHEVSLLIYVPNSLFILFLGFWLAIKGFSPVPFLKPAL